MILRLFFKQNQGTDCCVGRNTCLLFQVAILLATEFYFTLLLHIKLIIRTKNLIGVKIHWQETLIKIKKDVLQNNKLRSCITWETKEWARMEDKGERTEQEGAARKEDGRRETVAATPHTPVGVQFPATLEQSAETACLRNRGRN